MRYPSSGNNPDDLCPATPGPDNHAADYCIDTAPLALDYCIDTAPLTYFHNSPLTYFDNYCPRHD